MQSNNLTDTCEPYGVVNYNDLVEPQLIHKHQNNCQAINYENPADATHFRFVEVKGSECEEA